MWNGESHLAFFLLEINPLERKDCFLGKGGEWMLHREVRGPIISTTSFTKCGMNK